MRLRLREIEARIYVDVDLPRRRPLLVRSFDRRDSLQLVIRFDKCKVYFKLEAIGPLAKERIKFVHHA